MRRFLRDNSLSLVIFGVFFTTLFAGQMITGQLAYNEEREEHGRPRVSLGTYLQSDHFLEATMENWESEFLQMAFFVILSSFLFQRGSAESKDPDGPPEEIDEDPAKHRHDPHAPWPVRRGGVWLWLYRYSLSIAFLLLFVLSLLASRRRRRGPIQRRSCAAWRSAVDGVAIHGRLRILVSILPELAERISRDRLHGAVLDLATPPRLA